jgi:DNA-directed RNA polymerase subunit RPC12/RpoP
MTRKAITKKKRFDIFKRDGFSCQYCGATPPKVVLQVDHIHPVSKGGDNHEDNLITSCQPCNLGKHAVLLNVIPKSLKQKAAEVKEAEAQIMAYYEVLEARKERLARESWRIVSELNIENNDGSVRSDWLFGINKFIEKLGFYDVMEYASLASSSKSNSGKEARFKYFCGICWNKIREQNDV